MNSKSYQKIGVAWDNVNRKNRKYISVSLKLNEKQKLRFNLQETKPNKSEKYPDYNIRIKKELADIYNLRILDNDKFTFVKVGVAWKKNDNGKKRILAVLDFKSDKCYLNLQPISKSRGKRQPDYFVTISNAAFKDINKKYFSGKMKRSTASAGKKFKISAVLAKFKSLIKRKNKYDTTKFILSVPVILLFAAGAYAIINIPDYVRKYGRKIAVYREDIIPADTSVLKKAMIEINPAFSNYTMRFSEVSYIYDGDTIKLADNTRVRYLGVNTPEVDHQTGENDEPGARKAWEINRELTEKKKLIVIQPKLHVFDKYNRLLAYIYAPSNQDGKDVYVNVSMYLLNNGLGKSSYGEPDKTLPYMLDLKELHKRLKELKT